MREEVDRTEQGRAAAEKVVDSVIARCQRMQPKFAPGTAQHTLLKNRIQAMEIARRLLAEGEAAPSSAQELTDALEPVASALRKCEKARSKYAPDSGQYRRYGGTIQAMELARELMEAELRRRTS